MSFILEKSGLFSGFEVSGFCCSRIEIINGWSSFRSMRVGVLIMMIIRGNWKFNNQTSGKEEVLINRYFKINDGGKKNTRN